MTVKDDEDIDSVTELPTNIKRTSGSLTSERANQLLMYNEETGDLLWRVRYRAKHPGDVAGWVDHWGYRVVKIGGHIYRAHRVIFLMREGKWPHCIDHVDGNRNNNRISNLRHVDHAENSRNSSLRSDNKSGVIGVSWAKNCKKWIARIKAGNSYLHLGVFAEFEDACAARKAAEERYGYHANHGKDASHSLAA